MEDTQLDLHDQNIKTIEELNYVLDKFIETSYQEGHKNIRIITGRGLHSTNRPLLKPHTQKLLQHHKRVSDYRLLNDLGSFEVLLIN